MGAIGCSFVAASPIPTRKRTTSFLPRKEPPCQRWCRRLAHAGTLKRMRENAKDLGLDHYEVRSFDFMVQTHHAGAGGSCRLSRDLCDRALLHLSPCSIWASRSTSRASPDRPRSAPSPCTAHLALFFVCMSGSGLVVVASLPPKSCQLLPHETSSKGWLILAGSHSTALGFVLDSTHFPDFPEISGKCRSSWKSVRVLSCLCSFHERSSEYDASSCRRRCSSAWHSSALPSTTGFNKRTYLSQLIPRMHAVNA